MSSHPSSFDFSASRMMDTKCLWLLHYFRCPHISTLATYALPRQTIAQFRMAFSPSSSSKSASLGAGSLSLSPAAPLASFDLDSALSAAHVDILSLQVRGISSSMFNLECPQIFTN
jgi:hypothetical protein